MARDHADARSPGLITPIVSSVERRYAAVSCALFVYSFLTDVAFHRRSSSVVAWFVGDFLLRVLGTEHFQHEPPLLLSVNCCLLPDYLTASVDE